MNITLILDYALIAGSACFACFPLDTTRVRARWANGMCVICGVIGVAKGAVGLILHAGYHVFSTPATYEIRGALDQAGGVLLGLMFSLIVSGQLLGTRQGHKPTAVCKC